MNYNLLIEIRDPNTQRRVTVEDDGRTGYAYLYVGDRIVSDVWLYNRAHVPDDPSWEDREDLPFPNKRRFIVPGGETLILSHSSAVDARWDELGVDLYIDSRYTARLEQGAYPGWSRLAAIDSPIAHPLKAKLSSV